MFLTLAILVCLPTLILGGSPISEDKSGEYLTRIILSGVQSYLDNFEEYEGVRVEYDHNLEQDQGHGGFYIEIRGDKKWDLWDVRTSLASYGGVQEIQRCLKGGKNKLKVGCMFDKDHDSQKGGYKLRCQFE